MARARISRTSGAAVLAIVAVGLALIAACSPAAPGRSSLPSAQSEMTGPAPSVSAPSSSLPSMPALAHVVIVVLENHRPDQVLHRASAPFLDSLARSGLTLTGMHGVAHPSQPNYVALFSGSTHGIRSDRCPVTLSGPNLASALRARGDSFVGYSEGLPAVGYRGCASGSYVRKHNPWADFTDLPASVNQPLSAFPSNFENLPTVAFVIPDLSHDMHDGSVGQADAWLAAHLGRYAAWAGRHDSLLIITWDENDGSPGNAVATVVSGARIMPGTDGQRATHLSLLRTLVDAYGLAQLGDTARTAPITGTWQQ